MLQGKRTRRAIAATLLLVMLTDILSPTVSYALTSGPMAPEASSFEPVDTTDMVNLQTGDFTYNIPLLEIPGPEGGYPLSLAYHAGIDPNRDASWVGLGWSLNPGAITRDVSGYPDDYSNVRMTRRDFWSGGATTTYQFGVSVGLAGSPASVSFGLSVANDTYKGFGVGLDAGIGAMYGPLGIQVSAGTNPYGGGYAAGSVMIGTGVPVGSNMGISAVGSFTVATNFQSVEAGFAGGAGLSYSQVSLGASMSSSGTRPYLSVGGVGASMVGSSSAGKIQTSSSGFGLSIPITPYFGVYLGRRKMRYWSDETALVYTNGALNMQFAQPVTGSNSGFNDHAYDTYHLYDNTNYNMVDHPDAREALGGSFPDNDYYNVTAQGLSGNIRPYVFQEEVYIQNDRMNSTQEIRQWVPAYPSPSNPYHYQNPTNIQYRFVNDFSNKFTQTARDFSYINDGSNSWIIPNFDANPAYGDGTMTGYHSYNQELAGSKHIEYINNINLLPGTSHYNNNGELFYTPIAQGFQRRGSQNGGTELENSFNYQIGGYKITNESGVTYHYMLPAYSGNEYVYTRQKGNDGTFNMQQKGASYAYAWYLTAVTGPDYVDANADGVVDEGDWGYWVDLEYGKWCDDFIWRNPDNGYQRDLDNDFESHSAGKKDLYYLNKIKTATHTAIFEKGVRFDGKGISSNTTTSLYGNYPLYNGGYDATSRSTMQLNRILLLNNADANTLSASGGLFSGHHMENVFDAGDIPGSTTGNVIRSIRFNYDYSLCQNTPNSYDYSNVAAKSGKLTLNSIDFRGKGEASVMPPVAFGYDLDGTDRKQSAVLANISSLAFSGSPVFSVGDIVTFNYNGVNYYCLVNAISGQLYAITYLGTILQTPGMAVTAFTTKNPGYGKDNYDMWNSYKVDYDPSRQENGENYARTTTPLSAQSLDVWSLRTITSSLGGKVKIDYEADAYSDAVLEQAYKIFIYQYADYNSSGGYFWPGGYYYNSHTDNMYYYKVRNPEVFDGVPLQVGDHFDAIMFWRKNTNNGSICAPQYAAPLDTRDIPNSYMEVKDLSYFNSDGIIGFQLYNILSTVQPDGPIIFGQNSNCYDVPLLGNLAFSTQQYKKNNYGGGLRVKTIAMADPGSGQVQRTSYNYCAPGSNLSSGVTSYEPNVFDDANFGVWNSIDHAMFDVSAPGFTQYDQGKKDFKKKLYYHNMAMLSYTRELPSPGVMYQYVTTTNEVINPGSTTAIPVEGKTTYQFEVFNSGMVGTKEISKSGPSPYPGDPVPTYNTIETRSVALKDFTSRIGNVKRIIRYDDQGRKLSETVNNYLHDGLEGQPFDGFDAYYEPMLAQYNQQGVLQENFTNIRGIRLINDVASGQRKAVNATREEYPSIMTGQTVYDYKNNTTTSTQNLAFDFYSGALTKKLDIDAYGNRFVSQDMPAYRKYPEMGLRLNGAANKNMLVQTAESFTYKVDATNTPVGVVAASVQTWGKSVNVATPAFGIIQQDGTGNNGNVWRKTANYNWLPAGSTADDVTPVASFADFNWANPLQPGGSWKKTAEITLFDTYSNALEASDINGTYGSTKMGYNGTKAILTGGPARYNEIAYSGAEDNIVNGLFGGNVSPGSGTVAAVTAGYPAHTGASSLLCATGANGFTYSPSISALKANRNYAASVWVKDASGNIPAAKLLYQVDNGSPQAANVVTARQSGATGWYLLTLGIPASSLTGGTLNVYCKNTGGGTVYFDDFRFMPANSTTTAYVYDNKSGELINTLDNNNLYTRFEYDAMGKLTKTYKETFANGGYLVSESIYNYGGKPQFGNIAMSGSFTRNNCVAGGTATYTVPANRYFAATQVEANILAAADLNANGQAYANKIGTCIYVRMEFQNPVFHVQTNLASDGSLLGYSETWTADTYVRFYSDPACTTPLVLPQSLTLSFGDEWFDYIDLPNHPVDWGDSPLLDFPAPQGVSELAVGFGRQYFGQDIDATQPDFTEKFGDNLHLYPSGYIVCPKKFWFTPPPEFITHTQF